MDLQWRKASRSLANGACVEVAPAVGWRKLAGCVSGECVEVSTHDGQPYVLVRDSKDPDGPALAFSPAEWDAFLDGAKRGEFDDLT